MAKLVLQIHYEVEINSLVGQRSGERDLGVNAQWSTLARTKDTRVTWRKVGESNVLREINQTSNLDIT